METVAYVVERIVRDSTLLSEGLGSGLLSFNKVARHIGPEVRRRVPDARNENIAIALQRIAKRMGRGTGQGKYRLGEIRLRTGMAHASLERNETAEKFAEGLNRKMGKEGCTSITMGSREITVIFPEGKMHLFRGVKCLELEMGLALVTISFPEEMVESMGLIAHIMNETRWAGVNVREIFSTYTEIGILVREKESNELYRAMLRLKSQK